MDTAIAGKCPESTAVEQTACSFAQLDLQAVASTCARSLRCFDAHFAKIRASLLDVCRESTIAVQKNRIPRPIRIAIMPAQLSFTRDIVIHSPYGFTSNWPLANGATKVSYPIQNFLPRKWDTPPLNFREHTDKLNWHCSKYKIQNSRSVVLSERSSHAVFSLPVLW